MTSTTEHFENQLADAIERHKSGQIQEAMAIHHALLKQFPGHPQILYLSGLAYQDLGDLKRAMGLISRATAAEPDNGTFHFSLGILLKKLGYSRAAMERLCDARQRDPNNAETHFHLGDTHMDLGEAQEALQHFRAAIQLRPDFKEAWINLGLCLKACKQLEEALSCFQQVVDDHPQNVEGHINLGLTYLLMGNYPLGWQAYEWRLRLENEEEVSLAIPILTQNGQAIPRWDGSPLQGKTILILSEQGFGDTLQFVRYLSPLKTSGARILLTSLRPLMPLLQTLPTVDRIFLPPRLGVEAFKAQVAQERIDWFCPLISLPLLLETQVDSIPISVPYVHAESGLVQKWTKRLSVNTGEVAQDKPTIPQTVPSLSKPLHNIQPHGKRPLRIGLVWRGKPLHKNDPLRRRSCTLNDLAPLANIKNVAFFGLQKEDAPSKPLLPPQGMVITDLQAELHDFAQTAAILATLDLLISIDTSVAHLGGALGKPVWVLLPFMPDWRWFLDQETTPWYPTLRLFRQTVANCWKDPVQKMVAALPPLIDKIDKNR